MRFEGICKCRGAFVCTTKKGSLIKYSHANEIVSSEIGVSLQFQIKVRTGFFFGGIFRWVFLLWTFLGFEKILKGKFLFDFYAKLLG